MKKILLIMILTSLSLNLFASEVVCSIDAFGTRYEGHGDSEIAARVNARINCSRSENTMHCRISSARCYKSPTRVQIYCEHDVFGKLYYAINNSQRKASVIASGECMKNENQLHCRAEKVQCYDLGDY